MIDLVWWGVILGFFGVLVAFMAVGLPIAIAFLVTNILVSILLIGFTAGMENLVSSAYASLTRFSLVPIPLFVFMGALLFHSGLAVQTLNVLNVMLGRLPGRLSVLSILSGTVFAALSGSSIANTSMLGSLLVPDMERRGYHITMAAGPIMGAGSLAMIIPPSAVAILLGGLGGIPVGPLLLGGLIPGLLLALLFVGYIILACRMNPTLAPAYDPQEKVKGGEKLRLLILKVLPLLSIILLVLGLIFLGIATPTEAAAVGAFGTILIVAAYRSLNPTILRQSVVATLKVTGMIMLIVATSAAYSQLLAYTGATRSLVAFVNGFEMAPILIVILLLLIVVLLGAVLEPIATMMILLPLYVPIISQLGFDPVWFGIMMLICLDMGNLTPPVGMLLFVMKGVIPRPVPMADIYRSALPFVLAEFVLVGMILLWPQIVLWLPGLGR